MNKQVFDFLKKELIYLLAILAVAFIAFKIAFYRENIFVVARTVIAFFWLFVLPGYSLMLYWSEKLQFIERFVIGILLSSAIIGIFSYYFGILELNIKYHTFLLPLILIASGLFFGMRRLNKNTQV